MKRCLENIVLFASLIILTSCATMSTPPFDYRPGAVVETLSSPVSLSIHASDYNMGGNGFLVYRRPDQLHLVVLSPFGSVMMEAFALGEQITLVYPSQMTAYTGRFDELPEKGGLQGWRMMRWVMDADPQDSNILNGTVERVSKLGFREKVTFENGLVMTKSSPGGDQVYYGKYAVMGGVPVAAEVEIRNNRDDRLRLTLDEPEVNVPLDAAAFKPQLEGMTIFPLSDLKGL